MSSDSVEQLLVPGSQEPNAKQYAFLFTDLVNSTGLKGQLNAWRYVCNVLEPHDRIFRQLLSEYQHAHEIKHLGDGFLAVFGDVRDAVCFSLRFHHALQNYPWELDTADQKVLTRIGIDIGFAVIRTIDGRPVDVFGSNVDVASRVMSAADGGRTLLTLTAYEIARQAVAFLQMSLQQTGLESPKVTLSKHGEYRIQGVDQSVVLCEACLNDLVPQAPKSNPPKVINLADQHWEPETPQGELNLTGIPDRPGWKLVRKLGEGSFGAAYLGEALDDSGNQRVFKFCRSVDRLDSFRNELEILKQIKFLRRNDIVGYVGAHLDRPPYFLEFEYVDGGNLYEWALERGGLHTIPLQERLDIFAKIAAAVAAAHRERVFHLDLKPSNILIEQLPDGSWQPKLTDFGIGAVEVDGKVSPQRLMIPGTDRHSGSRTARHMYIPREVSGGSSNSKLTETPAAMLDVRDVYALGVLLFQFAIGDLQQSLEPAAIKLVKPKLLREDIEEATHFDPTQRLNSAAELERRVRRLRSRQRLNFLAHSFMPYMTIAVTSLVFVIVLCVIFYNNYNIAEEARVAEQEQRHRAETYKREKLDAFRQVWNKLDRQDLPLGSGEDDAAKVQLLTEIRHWLIGEAETDLEEIKDSDTSLNNQIEYARLTLRISELLDNENQEAEQDRLQDGLKVLTAAHAEAPQNPEIQLLISDLHNQLGQNAIGKDPAEATRQFELCLQEREQLVSDLTTGKITLEKSPGIPLWEYERKRLSALHNLAELSWNRLNPQLESNLPEPTNEFREALDLLNSRLAAAIAGRQVLATQHPESAAARRDLASSQYLMGRILSRFGEVLLAQNDASGSAKQFHDALQQFEAASDNFHQSNQLQPNAITHQRLVETLRELIDLQLGLGNVVAAKDLKSQLSQQVLQLLPSRVRDLSARVYFTDAMLSLKLFENDQLPDDRDWARLNLKLAEQIYETLTKLQPEEWHYWYDLGIVRANTGQLLSDSEVPTERKQAEEKFQQALDAWDQIRKTQPANFKADLQELYDHTQQQLKDLQSSKPQKT
ncbi:protein kinase [bacterium]|nr:protein kinase [bacterium]